MRDRTSTLQDSPDRPAAMRIIAVLAVALLLAGCATMNVTSDGKVNDLMLAGHDPVAYFTAGKAVKGDPELSSRHAGGTYYFASAANRDLFQRDPARYAPQFGGFCSNGIVYAIPLGGNADNWEIIDGRLYMFGGQRSRTYFLMDRERNLKLAHGYWDGEMKDMSSARLQAWKRLVFRVPHYKTNRDLDAEYQARQGKPPAS